MSSHGIADIVLPPKSRAIRIVAPSDDSGPMASQNTPSTSNQPKGTAGATKPKCRNITIHGFCKFEGKGCSFSHELSPPKSNTVKEASPSPPSAPSTGGVSSSFSMPNVNAPVFTPGALSTTSNLSINYNDVKNQYVALDNPDLTSAQAETDEADDEDDYIEAVKQMENSFSQFSVASPEYFPQQPFFSTQAPGLLPMLPSTAMGVKDQYRVEQMNQPPFEREPLQYHLYAPSSPRTSRLGPSQNPIHSLFIPENLRQELTRKNEATMATAPDGLVRLQEVDEYHSLVPLPNEYSMSPGIPSEAYKATSKADGKTYCLLRIKDFQPKDAAGKRAVVKEWKAISHSNIISFRTYFTSHKFRESPLVLVFDYHPCATPLSEELAMRKHNSSELWSYITQIAAALKAIHSADKAIHSPGFAERIPMISEVLVTSKNRLRLNGACVRDVLNSENEASQSVKDNQIKDLISFGYLIDSLISSDPHLLGSDPQIKQLAGYLRSGSVGSIDSVISFLAPHILQDLDNSQSLTDVLESELSRELENGRLVRLLTKMGFINERPEFAKDPRWSETGDRYIISLFRDYVFHQVDENGSPVVNLGHVLTCLNKLDAGVDEKLMLISRDEQSCLIVSYKEIKNCIASAFNELTYKPKRTPY